MCFSAAYAKVAAEGSPTGAAPGGVQRLRGIHGVLMLVPLLERACKSAFRALPNIAASDGPGSHDDEDVGQVSYLPTSFARRAG
jgi:hypothetical protein